MAPRSTLLDPPEEAELRNVKSELIGRGLAGASCTQARARATSANARMRMPFFPLQWRWLIARVTSCERGL